MLESRDACEFKLTKPLKFVTGRKDCISDDPEGRAYVTTKHEVNKLQFNIFHTIYVLGFPLSRDFFNFQVPGLLDFYSPGTTGPWDLQGL